MVIRGLSTEHYWIGPDQGHRAEAVPSGAVDDAVGGAVRLVAGESALVGVSVGMSLLAITTPRQRLAPFHCCLIAWGLIRLMSTPFIPPAPTWLGVIYLQTAAWLVSHLRIA